MLTSVFVLPQDMEVVPISEFPTDVQARMKIEGHEYAVTRPFSRVPTKVIDAQAAKLLRQFEKPTTLVQAILRFSKISDQDPREVLEQAYPFLESCLLAKLLVPLGIDSEEIKASFDRGARFVGWEVRECIQILSDSEVYRVRNGELEAALKIERSRSGHEVRQRLAREAAILARLDGSISPRLLFFGEAEGRSFLLTEWIRGEPCGVAAAAMRAREPLFPPLVELCAAVLDGYALLHGLAVIHSDVHPENILVTENGQIKIVDFGVSRVDASDSELALSPREGVGFYFEPEYAQAVLARSVPPPSSCLGEQYSAAALVYFLLSGQNYLDFSYAKEEVLHQIVGHHPVPLTARGLSSAGPLDQVLWRALSKDAYSRFRDMKTMARAFRDAAQQGGFFLPPINRSGTRTMTAIPFKVDQRPKNWLERTVDTLRDCDIDLPAFKVRYPSASVTYGAAGIAYGLFRIACVREDAELAALAERWLHRAIRESCKDTAFYHPDVQITQDTVGRISPYHTASGVACVQALLAHSLGDLPGRAAATARFLELSGQECQELDITTGRSGTLLALATLVDAFRWDDTAERQHLIESGNSLLAYLWTRFDTMPSIFDPKFDTSLGIAHGWAGYLYATLRWAQAADVSCPSNFQTRLRQLAEKSHWQESRALWPCRTRQGSPVFGGWCNGSAGFALLWTLASRFWPDAGWLALAKGAANDAFFRREEGLTLCCGLTGNTYSQLALYKRTGDRSWLENALELAEIAVRKTQIMTLADKPRAPLSLYKGDLGLAVLVAELERPEISALPFFEEDACRDALNNWRT
jgi:eukaryotic-like serine/threonine-protein kinase